MCGGVKTPPYKPAGTGNQPGTPRDRVPLPGGMYAAPTHKPNAIVTKKRQRKADVRGPHTCSPYKPTGDGR